MTERVLAAGGAVHVVLPFPADDFIATSVAPSGPAWVARFDEVLAAAASVTVVTDERGDDDDAAFARCSEVAMEMASAAARRNGAPAEQLALWNGVPSTRKGSTAADVARWKALGFPSTVVSLEPR